MSEYLNRPVTFARAHRMLQNHPGRAQKVSMGLEDHSELTTMRSDLRHRLGQATLTPQAHQTILYICDWYIDFVTL